MTSGPDCRMSGSIMAAVTPPASIGIEGRRAPLGSSQRTVVS